MRLKATKLDAFSYGCEIGIILITILGAWAHRQEARGERSDGRLGNVSLPLKRVSYPKTGHNGEPIFRVGPRPAQGPSMAL